MEQLDTAKKRIDGTAIRLLDAAEALFAENGFAGTSARDITSRAKCNVAAINYYFSGKDNLYLEVCKRRFNALRDFRIDSIKQTMAKGAENISLEDLLYEFSQAFLAPLIEEKSGPNVMKFMIREMLYPQLPANMVFENLIVPMSVALQEAMVKICPKLDKEQAMWSIFSLISQLVHSIHVQGMLSREGDKALIDLNMDNAVKHIVSFTAAGIRGFIADDGDTQDV